jgi:vacuolar-type H+-ATPase subunit F/Vma7
MSILDQVPVLARLGDDELEEGPAGETSLQLLQTVYRDRKQPLNVRVRCAVEALAHEYPRVSAVAVTSMSGQDFATALERAIERSRSPHVVNVPAPTTVEAEELKRPMPHYRNNFRRY